MAVDARFDTSKWAEAGPSRHKATAATLPPADAGADAAMDEEEEEEEEGGEEEDEEGGEDEDGDGGEDEEGLASPQAQKRKRVLEPDALDAFASKQAKRGIVYISYIPRGMTVAKVRHLLGQFGDVERIFLQDGDEKRSGVKRSSRAGVHYTEGWVEFSSKRSAKAVAEMLNAQPIGAAAGASAGSRGKGKSKVGMGARRWRDSVWTMRYLSGFKWGMLSEQLANERAARTARLRSHLSQSRAEQQDYLRKVERARVAREKEAKQKRRREGVTHGAEETGEAKGPARERTFKQKTAVVRDVREMAAPKQQQQSSGELQGVLSKIF